MEDDLLTALQMILDRIHSEPTMSGHLRNMHLKAEGSGHETSDAIRFAKQALYEAYQRRQSRGCSKHPAE